MHCTAIKVKNKLTSHFVLCISLCQHAEQLLTQLTAPYKKVWPICSVETYVYNIRYLSVFFSR